MKNLRMFDIRSSGHCCGIKDLEGMNRTTDESGEQFLQDFILSDCAGTIKRTIAYNTYLNWKRRKFARVGKAHYTLSRARDVKEPTKYRGKKGGRIFENIRKYIENRGLGTIVISPEAQNPNYVEGRLITCAIFTPDWEPLIEHAIRKKWLIRKPQTAQEKVIEKRNRAYYRL